MSDSSLSLSIDRCCSSSSSEEITFLWITSPTRSIDGQRDKVHIGVLVDSTTSVSPTRLTPNASAKKTIPVICALRRSSLHSISTGNERKHQWHFERREQFVVGRVIDENVFEGADEGNECRHLRCAKRSTTLGSRLSVSPLVRSMQMSF